MARISNSAKWPLIIVAVTFLALIAAAAYRSTISLFFEPMEAEFGWTRSDLSLAAGVNLIFYGFTAPFAGLLMERFPIRRIASFALALIGLGSVAAVTMTAHWQLVVYWGVIVGLGTGSLALVFGSIVASRWFVKRRGLVTGVFSAAYATGSLIFLPLLANILQHNDWRWLSVLIFGFCMLILLIFASFFRDDPSMVGVRPYGADESAPILPRPNSPSIKENFRYLLEALGRKPFWILAATFFVCGWTTNGLIGAHFIPATHDHGMPATTAASLLALLGIFDFIGTLLAGYLTDKVNPTYLLMAFYGFRGIALFSVPFLLGPTVEPPLMFFVVIYGLDWIATVPPTVELCRRYFGIQLSGVMFGWVFASHMLGAAIAAVFAGAIRDWQGSYFIAWMTAGILCLVAAASLVGLKRSDEVIQQA